jgi:hypothetical protein
MSHDYFKSRLHTIKQQLAFKRPSGAQIQIHGTISSDLSQTLVIMGDFVQHLVPLLPKD